MVKIDMDMPKNCQECPLTFTDEDGVEDYCVFSGRRVSDLEICRLADCPLEEVSDAE